jgi:hypothetical protein
MLNERTPPRAHAASNLRTLKRPPSSPPPSFRAPLDLVVTASNSDVPLDLQSAIRGIHRPSTAHLSAITTPPAVPPPNSQLWHNPRPSLSILVPVAPPPTPPQQQQPAPPPPPPLVISSLSAASASDSQFEAATNANKIAHIVATHTQSSKYLQLLSVLEELGKDVRPSYAGSKSSAERLKRGIMHARTLVRESLIECDAATK